MLITMIFGISFRPITVQGKTHLQVSFSLRDILKIYGDHTTADGKKTVFTELLGGYCCRDGGLGGRQGPHRVALT